MQCGNAKEKWNQLSRRDLRQLAEACHGRGQPTPPYKTAAQNSSNFLEKNVNLEQCKGVHCVDLGESFPTSIYLQNLASIQPKRALTSSQVRALGNFELEL